MGQEKVLVVETWFVVAHFLGFVPSPSGREKKLELSVDSNRQRSANLCFPTDLQHVLYTGYTHEGSAVKERNASALQSLFLLSFSLLTKTLMVSSGFRRIFLLLTQLVTFRVP